MRKLITLRRNTDGVAAVEFALIFPVLTLIIIGMLQLAVLFSANAGVQNAIGQAARFATIFPTPTDAQIEARIEASRFATSAGRISDVSVSRGVSNTVQYVEVSMTYDVPLEFVFVDVPDVSFTETRRAYLP